MKKILIKLTEKSLIIANTGEPFTAEGVISVCYTNLSAKSNDDIDVPKAGGIVKSIREKFLNRWTNDRNDYTANINRLSGTSSDYQNREILELLQNCIDAISDSPPIGAKGLGFKSIFNISLNPQIYSGEFNFCFDGDKTKEYLNKEKLKVPEDKITLAMLLPHNKKRKKNIKKICKQGYCTVIKCPLIKDTIYEKIKTELENIAKNPTFLLFVDDIDEIKINIDEDISVTNTHSTKDKFYLYTEQSDNKHISIAIPKDDTTEIPEDNISVYFPTKESIDLKAIVHGNFAVSSNRNEVIEKIDNFSDWDDIIKNLVSKIIMDKKLSIIKKLEVFKEYRGDFEEYYSDDATEFSDYLNNKIAEYYQDIEFIPTYGGGIASIKECVWWEYNDSLLKQIITDTHPDIKDDNLVCPKKNISSDLLAYFRIKEFYKDIPFYKTISGNARALTGDIPILLNLRLPKLFKLNEDYDVLALPDNIDITDYEESFIYDELPDNNCTEIINNKVSDNFDWDKYGKKLISFINKNENVGIDELENIKVPVKCNTQKWQDAHLVYAGIGNGGLDIDDILPESLILSDTDKKDLYKFLGVSYQFKIIDSQKIDSYDNIIKEIDRFSDITEHLKIKYSCEDLCKLVKEIYYTASETRIKNQIRDTKYIKVKGKPILQSNDFLSISEMYLGKKYEKLFATPDIPELSENIEFFREHEIQEELTSDVTEWKKYFQKFKDCIDITQKGKYISFYKTCEEHCDIAPDIDMLCSDGVFRSSGETYYYDTHLLQKNNVISLLSNEYPKAILKKEKQIEFFNVNYLSNEIDSEPNIGDQIDTVNITENAKIKYYLNKFIEEKENNKKEILEYDVIIVSYIKLSIGNHEIDDNFYIDDNENIIYIAESSKDKMYSIYSQAIDAVYRHDIKCIIDCCLNNRMDDLKYEFQEWGINLDDEDEHDLLDMIDGSTPEEPVTQIDPDNLAHGENNTLRNTVETDSYISQTNNTGDNNTRQSTHTGNVNTANTNIDNTSTQTGARSSQQLGSVNQSYQNNIPTSPKDNDIILPNTENKESIDSQSRSNAQNSSNTSSEPDSKTRKHVEKLAIQNATEYYKKLGYKVKSVEDDRVGWDLEATKGNEILQIEVKGRGNYQYTAKLTDNEYKKMKQYQDKGTYRLFISNRKGIKIFKYDTSKQKWLDQARKNYLKITEEKIMIIEATVKTTAYKEEE